MIDAPSEPATPARILEVATALFYARGYPATTMREIAAGVGIKAASLYNHFASKQEILVQIATETMTDLFQGGTRAVEGASTAEEKLRALVEWNVVFHAERRLPARVADEELRSLGSGARQAVVGIRDEYEGLFRAILRQGQAESGWTVPDTPVVTFAIVAMAAHVGMWYREDGRLSAQDIASIYGQFTLNAVGAAD